MTVTSIATMSMKKQPMRHMKWPRMRRHDSGSVRASGGQASPSGHHGGL